MLVKLTCIFPVQLFCIICSNDLNNQIGRFPTGDVIDALSHTD